MLTRWRLADWDHGQGNVVSNVVCASRESGIPIATISWMEFMPDPTGYFFKTAEGGCYWKNVPDTLDTHLRTHGGVNMWSLSVGQGGAWVTVVKSGQVTWYGVSELLEKRLDQSSSGHIAVSSTLTRSGNYALIQALTVCRLVLKLRFLVHPVH
jgi:hypothetical protein